MLGPLEVLEGNEPVGLGGARQRTVLAFLLIHRNEAVSVDRIVDALWGESPPATATKTVQVYISRLRKLLGAEAVATGGGGYALLTEPDAVDADRFDRLAAEGRDAFHSGDPGTASQRLREALDLWRGEALADIAYESFAHSEASRLEDLRLAVVEDRIDVDLALGRHAALVPELEALVQEHPTRERLRGHLMLALYRSGRQEDALEVYREGRRRIGDELGLEPGPELRRLEQAILSQDPELDRGRERAWPATIRGRRGAPLIVAGGALLLAVAVAAWIALGDEPELAGPNSLAVIDPGSNELETTVPTGVDPAELDADAGYVWVANRGDDTVSKIDAETRTVVATRSPGIGIAGMATGAGGVWIGDVRRYRLVRLDPELQGAERSVRVAPAPAPFGSWAANPVAVGARAVWTGRAYGSLARVNPETTEVLDEVQLGNDPVAAATGSGAVWVVDQEDGTLARIETRRATAVTWTTQVGQAPVALAHGQDSIWVANSQSDNVVRVDPEDGAVSATIPVGQRPTGVATGAGAVWVANSIDGTVSRIDPGTNQVVATIRVGEAPRSVTVADDTVWVSVQRAEPPPPAGDTPPGEVARLLLGSDPGPSDPALDLDYTRQGAICARLYSHPDRPAPEGSQLVPEIAAGPPSVSAGGRRYSFRLRSGYRFSPPSGEPVTASAFVRAIERTLDPRMGSYGAGLMSDVVGARAYADGRAREIAGLDARGDHRLIIELQQPARDLTARLSAPYFCPVPPDTPVDPKGVDLLPSAGPYYVASHDPDQSLVLRRNPNYEGPRPQELAEIRYDIGWTPEKAIAEIEAGRADYFPLDPVNSPALFERAEVAAAELAKRFLTQPTLSTHFFVLNATRPPFDDVGLRRAVAYAIDRRALAEYTGIGDVGRPTDQFLPPGIPGYADAAAYPLGGPDLERARRLAAGFRGPAVLYTCDTPDCARHAEILRSNLAAIGIELTVNKWPLDEHFERVQRPGEPFDIAWANWIADYVDPYNFLGIFDANGFFGHLLDDPQLDRDFARAATLRGDQRLAAYSSIDHRLTERVVPAVAFANGTIGHLFSARMGCEILHPVWGLDLAALCIEED